MFDHDKTLNSNGIDLDRSMGLVPFHGFPLWTSIKILPFGAAFKTVVNLTKILCMKRKIHIISIYDLTHYGD